MPLVDSSTYKAPKLFKNGHIQTLYPYFFRKIDDLNYKRTRIKTHDGDFLDIDYSPVNSNKLVILSHGLEGNSSRQYVLGMARHFNNIGVDALAWNMRSCSGEMNNTSRFYHAGDVEELDCVIKYAKTLKQYEEIYLIGFSLGANLTARYLGDMGEAHDPLIKGSTVFSAPCCLKGSASVLQKPMQKIYLQDFMGTMKKKLLEKSKVMDLSMVDIKKIDDVKSFFEFDTHFTAPLHGFKDAFDYYDKASCKPVLHRIKVPTLIINAKNDPFLSKECYPIKEAHRNKNLFLEIPNSGGHIGFVTFKEQQYWTELRAERFLLHRDKKGFDLAVG
ncbi:alpha/beta hydrolase [Halobacteriovorax sp. GB3]|uniref:YheT family hydrolase n=1 Tax=Halobacteriovorax sp. GB3 TaxID=2719615 RepID=UPI00236225A3|nr:alpha/beta fold hydrolase [Halobacteriovorax sp. GB3]MDD0854862.1 alpha/beta hydrolase [Halobacteriovorax sp. GB3]